MALIIIPILSSCKSAERVGDVESLIPKPTLEESLTSLEDAYSKNPGTLRVGYNLAYAYVSQNREAEALQILDELIMANPEVLRVRTLKAYTLKKLEKRDDYSEALRDIIALDKGNIDASLDLSSCLIGKGETEEARNILIPIMRSDPKNMRCLELLSKISPFYKDLYDATAPKTEETESEVKEENIEEEDSLTEESE